MKHKRNGWLLVACGICAHLCSSVIAEMPFVEIDPASTTAFRERGTHRPFVAIGMTYFDPQTGWAPKLWKQFDEQRVREQLHMVQAQGFNTIRVFITIGSFEQEAGQFTAEGEAKFRKLLALCRECSLYVIPTGPELWEGAASWHKGDRFADEFMLAAEESWWKQFAGRFADEPAIFAWDLANEPAIGWDGSGMQTAWNRWLQNRYGDREKIAAAWKLAIDKVEPIGQIRIPPAQPARGDARLLDYQRFREALGDAWTKRMAAAIRSVDRNHMVTVGHVQWVSPVLVYGVQHYAGFNMKSNSQYLDFATIHFYPLGPQRPCDGPEGMATSRAYLEALLADCRSDKPLMLGEFGWYGGGPIRDGSGKVQLPDMPQEHQLAWNKVLLEITRGRVCGWLNWAFADTPTSTDLSRWSGIWTEQLELKPWGKAFGEFARANARKPLEPRGSDASITGTHLDRDAALTDPAVSRTYLDALRARLASQPGQ